MVPFRLLLQACGTILVDPKRDPNLENYPHVASVFIGCFQIMYALINKLSTFGSYQTGMSFLYAWIY